jgi:hypothetical protein
VTTETKETIVARFPIDVDLHASMRRDMKAELSVEKKDLLDGEVVCLEFTYALTGKIAMYQTAKKLPDGTVSRSPWRTPGVRVSGASVEPFLGADKVVGASVEAGQPDSDEAVNNYLRNVIGAAAGGWGKKLVATQIRGEIVAAGRSSGTRLMTEAETSGKATAAIAIAAEDGRRAGQLATFTSMGITVTDEQMTALGLLPLTEAEKADIVSANVKAAYAARVAEEKVKSEVRDRKIAAKNEKTSAQVMNTGAKPEK